MITYSIIQKSQLEGATRLDAEYYQPEYLEFAKKLTSIGKIPLGKIAFITDGQHGYHKVDPNSEIRHITAKNVLNWLVNDEDADRLSPETHNANKRSNLEFGDLLISTAGTIGAVGIVQGDILPANIDQDVARVHILNQKEVSPYFLIAFLNSKYGQYQLIRETTGQIQTHVSLDKIKNRIFIPIPKWQSIIANLVDEALNNLKDSKAFFQQAEELLLEKLGLKNFKIEDDLSFIVNLSDVKYANRVDADYFQPKYEKLIEKIEKYKGGFDLVKNQFKQNKSLSKKDKDYYSYIEISDVNVSNGEIMPNKIARKEIPANGKVTLCENDLLISKVRPYRGAVSFIDFGAKDLLGSGAFTVLQEKTGYKKEVLMIFFKLDCIKDLLLRYNCGTSYPVIKDEDILNLKIPLINLDIQKEIAEMVSRSHTARKKSKELVEEAKRKVEEMIEKGK